MSEGFMVRVATVGDHDEMRALLATVDALHRENLPWIFREPAIEPRTEEFFERLLNSDDSTLLVAEGSGRIVGVAVVLMRSAPDFAVFKPQRWAVLDGIAVLESWRRRGVGTALTRDAERWAQSRSANWLELGVYEFNEDARSFYRALGYAAISSKLRRPFADDS